MPGIGYSDDKLLQTRIFSYADTQRHRLGPNYLLLPANAPRSAHHNNHHDGAMNFTHRDEEVNYFPSRMDPVRNAARTPTNPMPFSGKRERAVIVKENNFQQPGERFRSFDAARQERFIGRLCGVIGDPRATPEIRRIWVRGVFFPSLAFFWFQSLGREGGKNSKKAPSLISPFPSPLKTLFEKTLFEKTLFEKKSKQVGYLTQCDAGLGRRVAQKLQSMGAA